MESWKPSKASPVHVPLPLRHPDWDMGHLVGIVDDYRVDGPTVDCGENGVFSFFSFHSDLITSHTAEGFLSSFVAPPACRSRITSIILTYCRRWITFYRKKQKTELHINASP